MRASKIIGTSFDITIVDGRSSQTKIIKANMHLTDIYLEVPILATAEKTAKLVITTERGNTIFAINELDASSAKTYPIRLSKSLMGAITLEITTDAIVTSDKTFTIELRGYGWVVSDSAEQDGYYYAKLGSTNLYGLEHPSFRITEELNKIPSFEFEIANCEDNRTAIAAGITDVFRIYRRIYSVDTLMFTGIINGDAIEYLSLERIRITGYASYIDLNWRFHQHLDSSDAETVDKVFDYTSATYSYQKKGSITATTAGAQTNYQLELIVGESSGAGGADVHCSGHCEDFPNDIRFIKEDAATRHDYWVEKTEGITPNRKATVIIEVASIPASGSVDFYMHYGNSTVTSASCVTSTFIRVIDSGQPVIGAWSLNGNALDTSGNANNGTLNGGMGYTTGKFGQAGLFDSLDDYINCGTNACLNITEAITIEAWVKQGNNPASAPIITKGCLVDAYALNIRNNLLTFVSYKLRYKSYTFTSGIWYHVAGTFGDGYTRIYINGNLEYSKAETGSINTNADPLDIGWDGDDVAPTPHFDGVIDEGKIYNRALTGDEISDLYGTGGDRYGYTTTNYPGSVLVREYASPEPTWGTWGSEQPRTGTFYNDRTTEANNDTINDVFLTFDCVNDALYVGQGEQFFGMQVKYSTKGVQAANTTVVFEYSKGSSVWATLDVLDETRAFTEDVGTYYITIPHKPSDWAKDTVNSVKKFWIRARLSVGSYTTPPKLDHIKMTNTDVYRVYYFDTAADTIMDEVLEGTGYSMDVTDACPSDTISIVAEYETKLRIVAGIANALTWDDNGDKKGYQWWIDTSKKVHLKQKRGATLGDITGELTILNNIEDYFNLSNRLHFFGNYDGLNQLRAVVENTDSQDTHEIRELAVPEERYNNYIPLKEAAQKAMTYTKAPLQKIAATVTTKYWLDNAFEVGDTVTLHATSWDVASQAFQIVRADIGARVTNLDMGISQEHLDALKAGLQRQLDISGIRMHGSTTLLQFGPETMNYQRVDGSTVYPAHLKFEIPSDARYIHKVLVSWKLGPYRAEVTGGTESEGHDHTGAVGAGGDFTPEVEDGGAHTPTELSKAHSHLTETSIQIEVTTVGFQALANNNVNGAYHRHPQGVTGPPDDVGNAIVYLYPGTACDSGSCVDSWDNASFAEDTHKHHNTGLYTGYDTPTLTVNGWAADLISSIHAYAFSVTSDDESPAHAHTINLVAAHPHTGVYHGTHSDHVIQTAAASNVDLELGIIEVPGGTVMQLTVNGEDVTTVNGNGTDIVITGYCNTGSNTVELYPIVGSNTKGGATLEGRGILFIEAAKF